MKMRGIPTAQSPPHFRSSISHAFQKCFWRHTSKHQISRLMSCPSCTLSRNICLAKACLPNLPTVHIQDLRTCCLLDIALVQCKVWRGGRTARRHGQHHPRATYQRADCNHWRAAWSVPHTVHDMNTICLRSKSWLMGGDMVSLDIRAVNRSIFPLCGFNYFDVASYYIIVVAFWYPTASRHPISE